MMSTPATDHSLLVSIAQSLARLESKVDAINHRLDALDKRLDDHEQRLRGIEGDYVSSKESKVTRRWLIGLLVASVVTILATWANILFG